MEQQASAAKQAVVIGGSLGGLFAGLLLRSIRWDVDIYERSPQTSTAAGAASCYCAASVRQHANDQHHRQYHRLDERPSDWHSLRRQRGTKKNQADFENQQDGQSRISEPLLPGMDRLSRMIHDDRMALRPMQCHGPLPAASERVGDNPEGIVDFLVVAVMLPFR